MKCIKSNWIHLGTGHGQSGSCSVGTQTLPPRVCGYGPAAAVYITCGLFVFSHCDLFDATSPEGREAILRNDEVDRWAKMPSRYPYRNLPPPPPEQETLLYSKRGGGARFPAICEVNM